MSSSRKLDPSDILEYIESADLSDIDYLSESDDEQSSITGTHVDVHFGQISFNTVDLNNDYLGIGNRPTENDEFEAIPDYGLEFLVEADGSIDDVGLSVSDIQIDSLDNGNLPDPTILENINNTVDMTPLVSDQLTEGRPNDIDHTVAVIDDVVNGIISDETIQVVQQRAQSIYDNVITPYDGLLTDRQDIKWVREPFPTPIFDQIVINNGTPANIILQPLGTPFSYFEKYITTDLIDLMVEKTNLYSVQKGKNFQNLTSEEAKVFLGLQIATGTLQYPRMKMYWENNYRIPLFSSMSRNRFMSIRSNIHFVNNLDLVGTDRFAKVRPIFDAVRNRCQQLIVEEFVSI